MSLHAAHRILECTPLNPGDAARLIAELDEELGSRTEGLDRKDLIRLLRHAIHEGVKVVKASERTVSFQEAAWASIAARRSRRPTTLRDLRHFVRRMLRIPGIGQRPLRAMGSRECLLLLQRAYGSSPSSYRKGRAILHSIFAYGYRQEWCDANPVDRIPVPAVVERSIHPLAMEEVRRLERAVRKPEHRSMRLSLHLMLYCGIRPMEVRRMKPEEDIDWKEQMVLIRPRASKTGGGRVVPLRKAGRNKEVLIPGNWNRRWKALRRSAGFDTWIPDVCRHTFAAYHVKFFRNLHLLQLEMGHRDVELLRTWYILSGAVQDPAVFWR